MVNARYADGSGKLYLNGRWYLPPNELTAAVQTLPPKVRQAAEYEWSIRANRPGCPRELCGTAADPREAEASNYLRRLAAPFQRLPQGLSVTAGEEETAAFAERIAGRFSEAAARGADWQSLLARCTALSLDTETVFARQLRVLRHPAAPAAERSTAAAGIIRRLQDKNFWRRNLRRLIVRTLETAMRDTGWVNRRKGLYASQETVYRRRSQKNRNTALLEAMTAINELGEAFALSEIAAKSVSNPALRRAELMTRIAGFETIARAQDHAGEFITLTCPSRYHKSLHSGGSNPKYDGSTPAAAAEYLQKVWARIRADLGRQNIKPYGFRVAEPHHDGTPHWHLLLFMPRRHIHAFRRTLALHACRQDREELSLNYCETKAERRVEARRRQALIKAQSGEKKTLAAIERTIRLEADYWAAHTLQNWKSRPASRRIDFKTIDFARGSAAGYIAKYIAKNIDGKTNSGQSIGEDYEAGDAESAVQTAERVDAWASAWRIRQFQQIGGAPVGIWRELRRLDPEQLLGDDTLILAARAADQGDWGKFCRLMGGIETARRDMPLTLYKENNGQTNRYGEAAADTVRGIIDRQTGEYKISRLHEWQIKAKGGNAAPWTCVNNCTEQQKPASQAISPEETARILAACEPIDPIISWDALHPDTWDFDFGDGIRLFGPNQQAAAIEQARKEAQAERSRSDETARRKQLIAALESLQLDPPRSRRQRLPQTPAKPPRLLPLPGAKGKTPEDILSAGEQLLADTRRSLAAAEHQARLLN